MGIINMIKSLAKEVFNDNTSKTVKNGTAVVRGLLENRGKDVTINITEPEEKVIYEEDFSGEEVNKTPEVFVPETRISDEVYELTRKVNALAKELQEEKNKNTELYNEINTLKSRVNEYFGLINGLSQNISNLETETKKQSAQLGAINEKIRLINERIPSKAITWIAFGLAVLSVAGCIVLFFI